MTISNDSEPLSRLNFFYTNIFKEDIDMTTFDHRLKLQKLVYILNAEGINFNYTFTWYIYGPYSSELTYDGYYFIRNKTNFTSSYPPRLDEQTILERMKKARSIFNNSDKAELVASFMYLKDKYGEDIVEEQLRIRKPRFSLDRIRNVMGEWVQLTKAV